MLLTEWNPAVKIADDTIHIDDLEITFHRTIRVPDNDHTYDLPPSLGMFPLLQVEDYKTMLPLSMSSKGGLFFPMYQSEAMWINFESSCKYKYAIKIFVGGINVVSGEPKKESVAANVRRRALLAKGESIQDYIVVPHQYWLDGIAVKPGSIRQFVAAPMGTGQTVESQILAEETTGGAQFEITRLQRDADDVIDVTIKTLTGKSIHLECPADATVDTLKSMVQDREGIPPDQQRIICKGKELVDGLSLNDYNVPKTATIYLTLRLRGGGDGSMPPPKRPKTDNAQMGLAAGGRIKQGIIEFEKGSYKKTVSKVFNIQVLNSAHFRHVTGKLPPTKPLSATLYASQNLPFYEMYEEPTSLSGDFSRVKSVKQLESKTDEKVGNMKVVDVHSKLAVQKNDWFKTADTSADGDSLKLAWEVEKELSARLALL